MSDLRLNPADNTHVAPRTPRPAQAPNGAEVKIGGDHAAFSGKSKDAHAKGHEDAHSVLEDIAHTAHNPHGAMHAVEAGEHGLKVVSRVIGRAGRVAAAGAELTHEGGQAHHGLLGKLEHWIEKGTKAAGNLLSKGIRAIPGGGRALDLADRAISAPARWMGPGLDKALVGTRVGSAVKFTGAGANFLSRMGGRIPVLGSVLGGIIAVTDARSSLKIMNDPKATTKEKVIAGSQGGLSVISGVAGVGAMGVAAAAAIGFTAPVSVPLLLGVAAVTGIASFALSFFKKH